MNIDELFSDKGKKRAPLDSPERISSNKKHQGMVDLDNENDEMAKATHQEILDFVDNIDDSTFVESVKDEKTVKKMVLMLEKAISKNQEMRIKYPNNPEKYVLNKQAFCLQSFVIIIIELTLTVFFV